METLPANGKLKPGERLKPLVERAFELARSGRFRLVEEIERTLGQEGYPKGSPHWNSGSLRKQLRDACRKAGAAETEPSPRP